jgi:GNAT superfamily N-acetyltransferase
MSSISGESSDELPSYGPEKPLRPDHEREMRSTDILVSRALPAEYPVILNTLPQEWFEPEPHFLQLQIAEMVNANQFLIAHTEDRIVGTLCWQANVAPGVFYAKFLFVKPEYRSSGVAARLARELVTIAIESGQRAVFEDTPANSPYLSAMRRIPGWREVGQLHGFHGERVTSHIFGLDLRNTEQTLRFMRFVDSFMIDTGRSKK